MGGDASSDTGDANQSAAPESEMPGTVVQETASPLEIKLEEGTPPSSGFGFCTTGPRFCGGDDDPPSSNGKGLGVFCCASTGRDQGTFFDEEPDEKAIRSLKYKAAFELFDEDESGTIDKVEMWKAMNLCNVSLDADGHAKIDEAIDSSGESGVSFEIFVELLEGNLSDEDLKKIQEFSNPSDMDEIMKNNDLSHQTQFEMLQTVDAMGQTFDDEHKDVSGSLYV